MVGRNSPQDGGRHHAQMVPSTLTRALYPCRKRSVPGKNSIAVLLFVMRKSTAIELPENLSSELERKYFWWEPVGRQPRSDDRILTQAMNMASFEDVLYLETTLGTHILADAMLAAEPGWIDERSWEFWRGRLVRATGRVIPQEPPRRSFDARRI